MPSLKMKTKSTAGCLKEKYGLHIHRKSSMISKKALSHARIVQNAEEIGTFAQDSQDRKYVQVSLNKDLEMDEANHGELSGEENLFKQQQSTATDSGMEPTPSPCAVNIDTIFSLILKSVDACDNGGGDNVYVPLLDTEDNDVNCGNSPVPSEFYISNLFFSEPAIGSNAAFNCKANGEYDHECIESSLLCDMIDESMVLPFLENTLDTGCAHDGKPSEETIIDAENSSSSMGIYKLRSNSQDSHINVYPDPDCEFFDPQMYIRNLPDQQEMASNFLLTTVQNEKQNTKPITLVLDLDETLVHSSLDHCDDADFTFPVFFDTKEQTVYVKKRPHLQFFLERVSEIFEIVVFTASQSIYAKQLLDILDPTEKLISKRAYRESCILLEGIYTKDLTVLGVDLAKIAIIDNCPQVFRLQVNNGIPIKSWFDDPSDVALISLIPFLETLIDADDVRPIIAKKFGNKE